MARISSIDLYFAWSGEDARTPNERELDDGTNADALEATNANKVVTMAIFIVNLRGTYEEYVQLQTLSAKAL